MTNEIERRLAAVQPAPEPVTPPPATGGVHVDVIDVDVVPAASEVFDQAEHEEPEPLIPTGSMTGEALAVFAFVALLATVLAGLTAGTDSWLTVTLRSVAVLSGAAAGAVFAGLRIRARRHASAPAHATRGGR